MNERTHGRYRAHLKLRVWNVQGSHARQPLRAVSRSRVKPANGCWLVRGSLGSTVVLQRTVHRHVSNIFDKLGVHSRTAASYGIQHHIVDVGIL